MSALPAKWLKCLRGRNNTSSRATGCPRATGWAGSGLRSASFQFITTITLWKKAGDTPSQNIHEKLRYSIHIHADWEKQQIIWFWWGNPLEHGHTTKWVCQWNRLCGWKMTGTGSQSCPAAVLMYILWIQTWRGGRSPNIFLTLCQVSLSSG